MLQAKPETLLERGKQAGILASAPFFQIPLDPAVERPHWVRDDVNLVVVGCVRPFDELKDLVG